MNTTSEPSHAVVEQPMLLIDPKHPCQTPHRSFPRHYFVWMWEAGTMTELCRCTTCGTVEKITRFNGQ